MSERDKFLLLEKEFKEYIQKTAKKSEYKSYKVGPVSGQAWQLDFSGLEVDDHLITQLINGGRIAELDFSGAKITDNQLLELDKNGRLQLVMNLDLSNTDISDASVTNLKKLKGVMNVNFKGSKVTKQGAETFKKNFLSSPEKFPFVKNVKIEI